MIMEVSPYGLFLFADGGQDLNDPPGGPNWNDIFITTGRGSTPARIQMNGKLVQLAGDPAIFTTINATNAVRLSSTLAVGPGTSVGGTNSVAFGSNSAANGMYSVAF